MNFQEEELLRIFDRAIMPDSLHGQTLPAPERATGDNFQDIAVSELQNYCDGLEQKMIRMQQEINTLKHSVAQEKQITARQSNECESLRRQMEYDRQYLLQILNSRAWAVARMIHYLRGILTFNRAIILELKTVIDDRLLQEAASQSTPKRKAAVLLSALMHQATRTVKKIAGTKTPFTSPLPGSILEPGVYGSFYQDDERFPRLDPEVRAITFYLPQYHTFPENDEWWGKGFTEWTNTRKAKPRFPGHYQPRTPHKDIGYYDLSQVETLKRQAALAKAHGIDAFCMYYYWFDGKKLMEKPLDLLISHPEIDLKFCLCWANENWTRTWDGQEKSVLIQQNYSDENDIRFIQDLKKYITDPRYVRCDGKPVILIYHAKILPDPNKTFAAWRDWCRKNGVGEIQIWSCRTFIRTDEFKKPVEVDREVEFPPHMVASLELIKPSVFKAYKEDGFYYTTRKSSKTSATTPQWRIARPTRTTAAPCSAGTTPPDARKATPSGSISPSIPTTSGFAETSNTQRRISRKMNASSSSTPGTNGRKEPIWNRMNASATPASTPRPAPSATFPRAVTIRYSPFTAEKSNPREKF